MTSLEDPQNVAPRRRLRLISSPQRLQSLDLMRGLVVVGMIVANFSINADELRHFGVFPLLLHSKWAGFTLADWVFPAFFFMVELRSPHAVKAFGLWMRGMAKAQCARLGVVLEFLFGDLPMAVDARLDARCGRADLMGSPAIAICTPSA